MHDINEEIAKLLKEMTKDELIFFIQILEGIDGLHNNRISKNKLKKKGGKAVYIIGSVVLTIVAFQFLPKIQSKLENKIFRWIK